MFDLCCNTTVIQKGAMNSLTDEKAQELRIFLRTMVYITNVDNKYLPNVLYVKT